MLWQESARCREYDPDLFFPVGARTERRAKAICGRCPVKRDCLAFALDSKVEFGVWGGMSGRERQLLRGSVGAALTTHEPVLASA